MGNNKINLSIVHMIPLLRNRGKIANCSYIAIVGNFVFLTPQNKLLWYYRTREQNQQNAGNYSMKRYYSAWERIGATVHLVGSLKSGLLMKSRDIDLHIYTGKLDITESFSVMQELAERLKLKEIQYKNLVHTEEECIEWHVLYEDQELHTWKFDLIHIRKGSKYDGVVENVTAAIAKLLTPGLRETILRIKYEVPDGVMIPGIEIYHAVFTGDVRSYEELERWRQEHPLTNSLDWLP